MKRSKKRKVLPDEVHDLGPISVARFGELVLLRNNLTLKGQQLLLENAAKNYEKIINDINTIVNEIRVLVNKVNPLQLLVVNYFDFLMKNSEIVSEADINEDQIISMRMLDYIQSVIASSKPNENYEEVTEEYISNLREKVTQLYRVLGLNFLLAHSANLETKNKEYNFEYDSIYVQSLLLWVNVRGNRYSAHNIPHLKDLLFPHNEILVELFSITVEQLLEGLEKIYLSLTHGFEAARTEFQKFKNFMINYIGNENEKEVMENAKKTFEDNPELEKEYRNVFGRIFGVDLFDVKRITDWSDSFLNELSWLPGENEDFFLEGTYKGWPLRIEPIKLRPFLKIENGYYCFEPIGLMDNIYRVMQKTIIRLKPSYSNEWNIKQKEISEKLPIELFSRILPGAKTFESVYFRWYSSEKSEKKDWQETDGLVVFDDHLIIIEVKAGAFTYTSPANDFPAYIESIKNLLLKPATQTLKFIKYLKNEKSIFIYNKNHDIVGELSKDSFRHITACCVTIDNFTTLSAKAETLSPIGIELKEFPIWSLSIDDLRVYKDIFKSPYIFLHFLEERQRAFLSSSLEVDDELDHIGLYLRHNRYVSHAEDLSELGTMKWNGYRKDIDEYYSKVFFSSNEEKPPEQKMPNLFKSIISIADIKRGKNYAKAVSILLDQGGNEREEVETKIKEILFKQSKYKRPIPLNYFSDTPFTFFCRQDSFNYPNYDWIINYTQKNLLGANFEELLIIILDYKNDLLADLNFEFINKDKIPKEKINELTPELEKRYLSLKESYLKQIGKKKVGRNDHCPCGSGKKYKHCHGK